ncbi:hypothetical protein GPECTOR_84g309 [Gonium pectorale]|uniref:DUF676 domain-containing protein n=1 Tax=Gonium pectorale TaxID=33097 RepID=A0A150G186_GONPE|nr:hypothetical protein GPECTOR_84g309 [Gonium pectorale]|eukprot:KXZ43633.1 hypothetical protein GPECTOR_84g309 [Gonium pectorale]
MDIVFFHGLHGPTDDPDWIQRAWCSDWRSADGSVCWPHAWLPKAFPEARVWSVSYPSLQGDWEENLVTTARRILDQLLQSPVGIGSDSRTVVFVGHSLGGLILKQVLVEAEHRSRSFEELEAQQLISNLVGVVFYATPHQSFNDIQPMWAGAEGYLEAINRSIDQLQGELASVLGSRVSPLCYAEELPPAGWTLHAAAEKGHVEAVAALLQAGANKEAVDKTGATPLHIAAENRHVEAVAALLQAGADKEAANLV